VSSDDDSFTFVPAPGTGPRRVSLIIGLPVVLGFAVIGSILGFALPMRSLLPGLHVPEPPPELSLASVRLVEDPLAGGRKSLSPDASGRPAQPAAATPPPAVALGTGSLDRPLLPGVTESAALTAPAGPEVSRPEVGERIVNRNHRAAARSKKLRRAMARRGARPWKPQTSELEYFFGVPKK
jgi:hypothetical protein